MKTRKFLASLIALALLLSCMTVPAFAAETSEQMSATVKSGSETINGTAISVYSPSVVMKKIIIGDQPQVSLKAGYSDYLLTRIYVEECDSLSDVHTSGVDTHGIADGNWLNNINTASVILYGAGDTSSITVYYAPAHDLTSVSSLDGKGGVTFSVSDEEYTKAAESVKVKAVAKKVDGYTATLSASDNATDFDAATGVFTMPDSDVTVTATYAPITTGTIDLDLETDTTDISDSKDVKQYFTKTTGTDTVYKHKILVNWDDAPMEIKVADAKKWDYNNLKWVTDEDNNGVATVAEDTNVKTFTLTNYSAKAFTCTLGFTPVTASLFDSYTVVDENDGDVKTDGVTLDAVINDTSKTTTDEKYLDGENVVYTDLPTATMTATVNPKLEGDGSFAGAEAITEATKYGTFTITCTVAGD